MDLLQQEKQGAFDDLYRQLLDGSETAAIKIVELYYEAILRRLRMKLPRAIRSKYDTVDIAQSVAVGLASKADVMLKLDSPERFIAYAIKCAQTNMLMKYRLFAGTQARNTNREKRISDVYEKRGHLRRRSVIKNSLLDHRSPPGSAVAIAREGMARLLHSCTSAERQILQLRMSGLKTLDIADQLGISDRTVRHTLQKIRSKYYRDQSR